MKIIKSYNELNTIMGFNEKRILLLFSGGLDSCHTLSRLKENDWHVTALYLSLGEQAPPALKIATELADQLISIDVESVFCDEFLAEGIKCHATYYGGMPLSSTFTRPLIARYAIEYANSNGISIIASNVTAFQNTFFRFAKSIEILDSTKIFFAPSIGEFIDRQSKIHQLNASLKPIFIDTSRGVYSVDQNLWCKVVENGDIEHPERVLPIREIRDEYWSGAESFVEIDFENGVPIAVNKKNMQLSELIRLINATYKGHPSAFFYGLEGNVFGVKNPEPRVSMAGRLIHESSLYLAQGVLSSAELQLFSELSSRFAISIIEGGWYSSYSAALKASLHELSKHLSGKVIWRIDEKSCDISSVIPKKGSKIGSHLVGFTNSIENFGLSEKVIYDVMKEHTNAN